MKRILLFCCCIYSAKYINAQLRLGAGTNWTSTPATYVVLDEMNLQHDATSAALANVFKFAGEKDVSISGSTRPFFTNMELELTGSSKLVLERSINISNNLHFFSGLLDLNNNIIDLGSTGALIGESEISRIVDANTGYIQIVNILNAPSSVNPGNLGATITSFQNLGSTTIRRSHYLRPITPAGGTSIFRTFQISPTNNTSLDATLRFSYFEAELNSLDESSLVFWRSPDEVSWTDEGYTTRNPINNYVEKIGINSFSSWTLSRVSAPLPVTFTLFNARCMNGKIFLNWRTAQEINSRQFIVEKSSDGNTWNAIGNIAAAGNSNIPQSYELVDNGVIPSGYYRIAEHDINGRITYTSVLRAECNSQNEWKIWPNPIKGQLWVNVSLARDTKLTLKFFDNKGSLLLIKQNELLRGTNLLPVDLGNLPAGTYHLLATWDDGQKQKIEKIIKL